MAPEDVRADVATAPTVTVTEAPKFDLKQYISAYRGRTVFRRLYLIASCSTVLKVEATKLALVEARRGHDTRNYQAALELLKQVPHTKDLEDLLDHSWIGETEKKNAAETKRMENELKQYKNNLIRESIRMGNEDLGSHYHNIGDLSNAVKAYSRMREYCTTPTHIASTAFRIIAVAIEQRHWLAVQSQVHKIRNLQMRPEEAAKQQPKISAAMGLQQMSMGDFKEAAASFLAVDASLGDSYSDVLTSNDVAVYGGLCALASMTRSELQSKVLENALFRNFLELEPQIRRAITYFVNSKYNQCLEILKQYRADWLLDIYLQPQLENILQQVRTKSMVQYFQPFSRVTLQSMEQIFAASSTTMSVSPTLGKVNGEAAVDSTATGLSTSPAFMVELVRLIDAGLLDARIDTEKGVLVANRPDRRRETQDQALRTVDRFIKEAQLKLLRMGAISAGIEIKPPPREKMDKMNIAGLVDP